ncbi:hypothetical protein [Streptomyces sp. NBC_00620]|uniref:hypothetical protein n=1 Tax=Streptomyces sp. NBC_00620 TaxID=2903666 RepID=UPI00225042EC|nr:hypothetical protein [Streptomyces sp. NBC_00620]MCX4976513.1 hypothetical protein [Streptomyces sp. NBC_00620]
MATATTAPTLTTADVTVTTDHAGRVYAVIPDDVARPLAVAAKEGIDPEARGTFFESRRHPADSWAAATVRTVFTALLDALSETPDVIAGLGLYRRSDGGTFYGFIVGTSAWGAEARWWLDYGQHDDLIVRGAASIEHATRGTIAGTCTF